MALLVVIMHSAMGLKGLRRCSKQYLPKGSSEDIYYKHNMLAGFKRVEGGNQGMQLNIATHKSIEPCSHHKQYAGLKVGDNYSFGFMR